MNVYVDQSVRALAAAGHVVDVFTADPGGIDGLAANGSQGDTLQIGENIRLHQLPVDAQSKDELADAIDELALVLLARSSFTGADLIWAHYWISAEAALRAQEMRAEGVRVESVRTEQVRTEGVWTQGSPVRPCPGSRIVASMHTIGAVKNRDSETSHERPQRLQAEERIASAVDLIVANTPAERRDLIHELGADPASVVVARPGVDHELFTPGDRSRARAALGLDPEEFIVLYVGRMQFIKGTDIVVDAISGLRENDPHLASRTRGILLGAVSGQTASTSGGDTAVRSGGDRTSEGGVSQAGSASSQYMRDLSSAIVAEPSVEVRFPVPAHELVTYYRAADILLVPSRSESFGLVAAEASAAGLPAIASAVGGLPDIVEHGHSGVLIADHNPRHWAMALERMLLDDELRRELSAHAADRSARFDWSATVATVLDALGAADPALTATMTTTEESTSLVGGAC
ncbi:D-inositol-3-phosphate glycosyltransferase [Brevibacterium marinum]|nr:glycosyltransferase [Brevibacterium marinum]